jgi:hypothetical protein
MHLLKKKNQVKRWRRLYIEKFYGMHKLAYFRRLKNKIKHSIKILEIEVERTGQHTGSEYCSNKHPSLDDYDRIRDKGNYEAYYGDWDEE